MSPTKIERKRDFTIGQTKRFAKQYRQRTNKLVRIVSQMFIRLGVAKSEFRRATGGVLPKGVYLTYTTEKK